MQANKLMTKNQLTTKMNIFIFGQRKEKKWQPQVLGICQLVQDGHVATFANKIPNSN